MSRRLKDLLNRAAFSIEKEHTVEDERYASKVERELLVKIYYQPFLYKTIVNLTPGNFSPKLRPVFEAYRAVWASYNTLSPGLLGAFWGDPPRDVLIQQFVGELEKNSVVSPVANDLEVDPLVEELKTKGMQRSLLDLGEHLLKKAPNCSRESAEALCAGVITAVKEMAAPETDSYSLITDTLDEVNREYAELFANPSQLRGISWGYPALDSLTNGLVPGEVTVVAARPSVGKTTFALNIVLSRHYPSIIFSLEMSANQLTRRMVDAELGCSVMPLVKAGRKVDLRAHPKFKAWKDWNLILDAKSSPSPEYLYFQTARAVLERGVKLVVVDYIQLVAPAATGRGQQTRDREIAVVMSTLKNIARDFKVPVIAISQLNRGFESRGTTQPNKPVVPILSDLRDSGSIEQDADVVVFLIRVSESGLMAIVKKNRNGGLGDVQLNYDHAASKITQVGA